LPAFFIYAFLLTGFFYPVASRWVWHPSGWLKIRGFIDFGGSGCVHMIGGVCALVILSASFFFLIFLNF
jgi:Amt family ammonium transporter